MVGRGAIADPGRKLLAGDRRTPSIARWRKVLPEPIDHFLLQADLTVVVPGPLERDLAEQLACGGDGGVGGCGDGVPDQRAVDPARTGHRSHGKRAACLLRAALQNACAAGLDLSHRRRRPPARPAAGRDGRVVRPVRGSRTAGPGGRRARRSNRWRCGCSRRPSRCPRRRSPRCSPRCATAGFAPAAEDSDGRDRRHPRPRCPGARAAAAPRATVRRRRPRRPDAGRDRRRAAQGGGDAVRRHAARPGRGDVAAAGGRAPAGVGGDRLRRPGRGGHPAGGGADQRPRRPADRVRPGVGPGPRLRHPPRHVGGVGRPRPDSAGLWGRLSQESG